jgi:glycerol-3-phosphate dehydrogenase
MPPSLAAHSRPQPRPPSLDPKVRREDVLSSWSGIRPLASDPTRGGADGADTASLVREHVIFTDPDGLVTVGGGS